MQTGEHAGSQEDGRGGGVAELEAQVELEPGPGAVGTTEVLADTVLGTEDVAVNELDKTLPREAYVQGEGTSKKETEQLSKPVLGQVKRNVQPLQGREGAAGTHPRGAVP